MVNVLYLLPELPVPVKSGGNAVFKQHVERLAADTELELAVVVVDVDGKGSEGLNWLEHHAKRAVLLPREAPRLSSGFRGMILSALSYLRSDLPWGVAVRASSVAHAKVRELLPWADVVVMDNLFSLGTFPQDQLGVQSPPTLLIHHDVESVLYAQRTAETRPLNPMSLVYYIDELRMRRYETTVVRSVAQVACISNNDVEGIEVLGPRRAVAEIPFTLKPAPLQWRFNGSRRLLFVGPIRYFPNREAIEWICMNLAPRLHASDPDIRIDLVGTRKDELPQTWAMTASPILTCHGYVSREELVALHYNCDLFLCPLILGSGIKIKVVEALSFGMPVLSTDEGLKGMGFATAFSRIERDQVDLVTQRIVGCLHSRELAEELATANRATYAEHWTRTQNDLAHLVHKVANLSRPTSGLT